MNDWIIITIGLQDDNYLVGIEAPGADRVRP